MSDNFVITKSYASIEIDRREALRYAGVRDNSPEMRELLDGCIAESADRLTYKLCYREYDIKFGDSEIDLGFTKTSSASLINTLFGCRKIIVFCATVGVDMDRLIQKYALISPARSVMLQALGSERVEAICDRFCEEITSDVSATGGSVTRRFSPGYGDLLLDMQREIFVSLNPQKHIGVSLGADLFMTPTKSVTAIIGIKM